MANKMVIKSKRGAVKASSMIWGNLEKALDATREGVHASLRMDVTRIYDISRDLVPRDTGQLHDSANMEGSGGEDFSQFRVSYHTKYAAYIHERMDLNHYAVGPKKRNPKLRAATPSGTRGQAKFLSEAANIVQPDIADNAADEAWRKVRAALSGGSRG